MLWLDFFCWKTGYLGKGGVDMIGEDVLGVISRFGFALRIKPFFVFSLLCSQTFVGGLLFSQFV